mmetsp:Transcript_5966/g.12385  ORF Transcript_5966/g.12385 Transcript_5966/m.12385 type:complete len:416 (-) Transcript_5966:74-1321(-)
MNNEPPHANNNDAGLHQENLQDNEVNVVINNAGANNNNVNLNLIPTGANHNRFPEYMTLTNLDELEQDTDGGREDVVLIGCLIDLKYKTEGGSVTTSRHFRGGRSMAGPNKAAKFGNTSCGYRRLFTFVDIQSKRCFAVIEGGQDDETAYWRAGGRTSFRIGDYLGIKEPFPVERYIAGSLPIVRSDDPFKILRLPCTELQIPQILPKPESTTDKCPFIVHGLGQDNITIHTIKPAKAICNGYLCDRQRDPRAAGSESNACGCYETGRYQASNVVLKARIVLRHAAFARNDIEGSTCITFMSWRLSNLLFKAPIPSTVTIKAMESREREIREAFRQIDTFVKDHGGWSAVGWFKSGSKRDASSAVDGGNMAAEDTVVSEDRVYHICSLYPTNTNLVGMNVFRNLQLDTSVLQGVL